MSPDGRWVACLRTRRTSATRAPGHALRRRPRGRRRRPGRRAGVGPLGHRRSRGPPTRRPWSWPPTTPAVHRCSGSTSPPGRHPAHHRRRRLLRPRRRPGRHASTRCGPRSTPRPPRSGSVPTVRCRVDPHPPAAPALPGTLTEVTATAADGTPLRAWLVLPDGASATTPAPLLLWIHGGPLSSWNGWHWRWNPWLMAAHGYAVLLPDPALSTGYGRAFVRRGWGRWGAEPYTDVLAADRRGGTPSGDRRRAHGRDGRLVRRLPGQLGGRAHRPLRRRRHAREPVGARPVRATTDTPDYWRRELTPQVAAELTARTGSPTRSARRCW